MDSCPVDRAPIQASGYFDSFTKEYALSICSGSLLVTFDFLKEDDVRELLSCLSCMLGDDETPTDEQRQANLDHPRG